ncbi:hypothetical protein [Anaeromyxobacter oryzae]|uniref:Uncharacterized protein n=1 Tax=Anaeromyxobacter oryzae TaxID=2918170 RepID=A0ABM7WWG9_9BACT|nr:hypothetical protein [Anaeromyxobacter oryzae]BDG03817.1 hypothetical protein AMOR_28130 [Anaeromyxobacter oryzae]
MLFPAMGGHGRVSWLPWRGPNPVRWTLALALCVVAAFAAGFPSEWRDVAGRPAEWWNASVPPLATWAALAALAVALPLWPLRRKEPFV